MFDFSNARDHMVESQIRTSDVTDVPVLAAFRRVKREAFVPNAKVALAYGDSHITLDDGRVMLRPRDLAKMVQAAEIEPTDIVLDLACARGYSTAILSHLADTVVGVETSEEAVARATELLVESNVVNAAVVQGHLKSGAAEHGPFNVIIFNGAVHEVPKAWVDQLANDGRLVTIVQKGPIGHATLFQKSGDVLGERILFDTSAPYLPGFAPEPAFTF
ncbi:protein-L-isoaspartate O-methyltransferase family protein [Litorimonas sp. RW-G-Af-16]|uniref:protein-L-isoaspartate O-methyltransferase family protein n=1 Tax=Litorimonas sp. RW-G-Af-16 TaxID=3241168 RepID=UPI00390C8CC0